MSLKTENSRRVAKSRPVCIWALMVKAPRIMRKAPNKMPFNHLRQLWLSIWIRFQY